MRDVSRSGRDLLTAKQVAEMAGTSVWVVNRARVEGHLKGCLRRGTQRVWRYERREVISWMRGE